MILFAILMLLNFTVPNETLFEYRRDIAGFPVNILDVLLFVVFFKQLFTSPRGRFPTERFHPLLPWSIGLLLAAIFIGIAAAMLEGTSIRGYVTVLRNLTVLPVSIFIGYALARTPKSAKTALYIFLFSSVASAISVLVLVRETSEMINSTVGFDKLRTIRFGGEAGLIAMSFLAFAAVSRARVLPKFVSVVLLLVSAVGYFSMPHRGFYVMGVCALLYATLLLPNVPWRRRIGMSWMGALLIGTTLLAGAAMLSQVTGRDFKTYVVETRLKALIPYFDDQTKTTVTGTRLPGILAELRVWSESPLLGKGFAISTQVEAEAGAELGMNHNVWTAALAQCGPIGLAAYLVPIFGSIFVGYRMWRGQNERYMALLGAMGSIVGMIALLWGSLSLSINQQRPAMLIGLMFGLVFRCRAMQKSMLLQHEYDQYAGYSESEYDAPLPA
jgi:hypothetical protein